MDNILGGTEGFFSVGELSYIWERGLLERRLCGCGKPLPECEIWSDAVALSMGGVQPGTEIVRELVRIQRSNVRVRNTWRLLRHESHTLTPSLQSYVTSHGRLYQAIAQVTGAQVIVDSTKRPSDGALLRLMPQVTPYFVHLVRDPRAVAYSWRRRKAQLDRDRPAEMVAHGTVESTLNWTVWNLAAEAVDRRSGGRSILVRYEDFVSKPRATLARMLDLVEERRTLPFETERSAHLTPNHTVSGNPRRFSTGAVEVRADDEWLSNQRTRDRFMATILAAPLLRRYGYSLRPSSS